MDVSPCILLSCLNIVCLFYVFRQFDFFLGQHRYSWVFFFNRRINIAHRNVRLNYRQLRQFTVFLLMFLPKLSKGFEDLTFLLLMLLISLVLLFLELEGNSASRHEKALLKHLLTDFIQGSKWKFLSYFPERFPFHPLSSLKLISVLIFVSNLDSASFLKLLLQL